MDTRGSERSDYGNKERRGGNYGAEEKRRDQRPDQRAQGGKQET